MEILEKSPNLRNIVDAVLEIWPAHEGALKTSLGRHAAPDFEILDDLAGDIVRLASPSLSVVARHYRDFCGVFLEEEFHFRRTGEYRCKTFADAKAAVYDDAGTMVAYMDCLLLSQVLWANHAQSAVFTERYFLPSIEKNDRCLEIGPGHGLLLARLARGGFDVTAYEISAASAELCRNAIATLGPFARDPRIELKDAFVVDDDPDMFDRIVMNEVLEHLEDPVGALRSIKKRLCPGGTILVNVPVNSPAPDHIFLYRDEDAVKELFEVAGMDIISFDAFPMTGYTVEDARAIKATISCAAIISHPD